jgi:UDP-2-acetamido-3-amino-2,3-dideoxy-glucuronate N-acetyltransferase
VKGVFVHDQGICESTQVGEGTRVWAFAHVLPGARIGRDCNLCDHVFVENDVVLGDRVTVKSGVQLWDGVRLGDDVFVGPNATFTNDPFPRSKRRPERFLETVVARGASVGAGATILPGLTIGAEALVGAGAVVTHDVPPKAIVYGNPARITGYVGTGAAGAGRAAAELTAAEAADAGPGVVDLGVGGVALHRLPTFRDLRGSLCALEFAEGLPFVPARMFMVYDVTSHKVRGEHAHKECAQFLVASRGALSVVVDDGARAREVRLDTHTVGLFIPPRVWGVQYKFTRDALLTVLASHPYDAADYVRDYGDFLRLVGKA